MFWINLLIWVVTTVAVEIIRPKPSFEDARPASLGDFNVPTATEGRAIPVVWGRVKLQGPNVVWHGGFRKTARTENVSTGLFSDEDVIIGYRYYMGLQFALCHGPVDFLRNMWVNEKDVLGSAMVPGAIANVERKTLFGGEKNGTGGIHGNLAFYGGDKTQAVNSYLTSHQSPTPAYRGTCYAVWQGGWLGNSANLAPFAFEVERIPDGLNLEAVEVGSSTPNTYDCNPMNVLYEILTDTDWGLSIDSGSIDIVNFKEAASTLYAEGNGFSMVLDSPTEVSSMIAEIQRQIDGALFFNRGTAQWQVKLARGDYDASGLEIYDETKIVELKEFTRQTWEETTNQVRVAFVDRNDEYKSTFALAQDPANMDIQGQAVQSDVNYPGVKVGALANALAWRDLRVLSYPLSKVVFSVNRSAYNLAPGAVFKFSWANLGITEEVYRVGSIGYGRIDSNMIEITAFQDVFATSSVAYSNPTSTLWENPNTDAIPPLEADSLIFEGPRQMILLYQVRPTGHPTVWSGARQPSDFTLYLQKDIRFDTSRPLAGAFNQDGFASKFLVTGTLAADETAYGASIVRPSLASWDIDIEDALDDVVVDGGPGLVSIMTTIAWINGEFIGFEKCSDIGGDQFRLERVWRGLFNSAPRDHTAGDRIWFIAQGGSPLLRTLPTDTTELDLILRGVNAVEEVSDQVDSDILEISLTNLAKAPLAPHYPVIDGTLAPATPSIDTQYTTETGRSGDDARAMEIEVTPRDWLVDNILLDHVLSSTWGDFSEEFDFYLVLDPDGSPIEVGPYTIDDQGVTPTAYILRNDVILAVGDNASIPATAQVKVTARQTVDAVVYTNPVDMTADSALTSSLMSADDLTHGAVDTGASPNVVEYGENGNYTFDIGTVALPSSGKLQGRLNGGSWVDIIIASGTSGILAVTAGDDVELQTTVAPGDDQFFTVTGPTAEVGYGVLES